MFPTRNGTGVLFVPAYIDHGSTSRQSNGEEEVDQQSQTDPQAIVKHYNMYIA